jgi:hypothetical protein
MGEPGLLLFYAERTDRLMAATGTGRAPGKKGTAGPEIPAEPSQNGNGSTPAPRPPGLSFDVVRLTPRDPGQAPDRVPVFAVTDDAGQEHVYTAPAKPDFYVTVEYGYRCGRQGVPVALDWLMDEMLGTDGYHALRTYPGLTPEQFNGVLRIVTDLALGKTEAPKES